MQVGTESALESHVRARYAEEFRYLVDVQRVPGRAACPALHTRATALLHNLVATVRVPSTRS